MKLLRAKVGYVGHSHFWVPPKNKNTMPWHSLCGLKRFRNFLKQDVNTWPECARCNKAPRAVHVQGNELGGE